MHIIETDNLNLRTDLVIEYEGDYENNEVLEDDLVITTTKVDNFKYTTIAFSDITDKDNFLNVQNVFIKELKKYLDIQKNDKFLIIGLGNKNSTPDSLGPATLDNILVTGHLYLLGDIDSNYSHVCKFMPSVTGETGIETIKVLKSVIKESGANKVIVIDSLKASKVERLNKIIQITNSGIHPGSGINNNRGEVSEKTMNASIVAIGVPSVVDVKTIVEDILKEEVTLKENLIVTPTNIDFIIQKLGLLIGNGINISLHKDFKRQNNY